MSWIDRVALSDDGGGIAHRPNEVIAVGDDALAAVLVDLVDAGAVDAERADVDVGSIRAGVADRGHQAAKDRTIEVLGRRILVAPGPDGLAPSYLVDRVPDAMATIRRLRAADVTVQPNHVFLACPLASDPARTSPVYASPVYASPVYASPVQASGRAPVEPHEWTDVRHSPVPVHPVFASPNANQTYRLTGQRLSTARAAVGEDRQLDAVSCPEVTVVVIDTGIAEAAHRPTFPSGAVSPGRRPRPATGLARPAFTTVDDPVDANQDDFVDPAAGHGTFIGGIIERMAPGTTVRLDRAFWSEGDGDEWDVVDLLDQRIDDGSLPDLLNLSFSGYVLEDQPWGLMRSRLTRIMNPAGDATAPVAVVAAAGNDATSRPNHPAAFPGVIGVGALGPAGPAPFTNHGPWVSACAPGVDLVSRFYVDEHGSFPGRLDQHPDDPDQLTGWARWSGTSFATPVVVGALARRMQRGLTVTEAIAEVITNPGLLRIPGLGTVVNEL